MINDKELGRARRTIRAKEMQGWVDCERVFWNVVHAMCVPMEAQSRSNDTGDEEDDMRALAQVW